MRRARRLLLRGLLLRCPACGRATFVRGLLSCHEACRNCGLVFEHDDGFFLGAVVLNYTASFLLGVGPAIVAVAMGAWSVQLALIYGVAVSILLPVLLYWHAKSLWLAVFYTLVPDDLRTAARRRRGGRSEPGDSAPLTAAERERREIEAALAELEGGRRRRR